MSRNPRTAALLDGRIETQGFSFVSSELRAPDIFWRQLRFHDFDVSEMSLSSLLMITDRGNRDWVALPVLHDRRFFHTYALVRPGAGITSPEDLRGREVGVPDYQQTAALWTRAVLSEHFGLAADTMSWHMERLPSLSHGGAVGFDPPPGVRVELIPESESIGSMLMAGTLDAAIVYEPALLEGRTIADRSPQTLPESAARWLFEDRSAEAVRSFGALGFVPANHCVIMRRSLAEQHPWLALNIYEAFLESKLANDARLRGSLELYAQLGLAGAYGGLQVEPDLYAYGYTSNRQFFDVLAEQSWKQGLTSSPVDPARFLAEATLEV